MHSQKLVLFILFEILFFLLPGLCPAQVQREWVVRYNGLNNSNDIAYSLAVDDTGNVFVTGGSNEESSSCLTTIKYNSSGIQQWLSRYYGTANGPNEARSIKLDKNGNVYVVGTACVSYSLQTDIVTIKYNPAGIQQWLSAYKSQINGNCWGASLVLDDSNNVYVAGTRMDSLEGYDFVTIKYSPSGVQQWVKLYNGPSNYTDYVSKIIIDDSRNLYVSGISWTTPLVFEYAIVKYSSSGVQQWVIRQFGSDNTSDYKHGIAVDRLGYVFFAGSSGYAGLQYIVTARYNSSGSIQWMATYNAPGFGCQSEASSLVIDTIGNAYVTGYSLSPVNYTLQGCITIKYNSSGVQQWLRIYGGTEEFAGGTKILVDDWGYVYVVGSIEFLQSGYDYLTLSYDNSGTQRWADVYNGTGNNTDIAYSMALDRSKNVFVTGFSSGGSSFDFATIKYSQPIGIRPISSSLPKEFSLSQNYPNPFNPKTIINFQLPMFRNVRLIIYDVLGREVAILVNQQLKPGTYEVDWDASDYPSGVYFYKLISESFIKTKKMILLK